MSSKIENSATCKNKVGQENLAKCTENEILLIF